MAEKQIPIYETTPKFPQIAASFCADIATILRQPEQAYKIANIWQRYHSFYRIKTAIREGQLRYYLAAGLKDPDLFCSLVGGELVKYNQSSEEKDHDIKLMMSINRSIPLNPVEIDVIVAPYDALLYNLENSLPGEEMFKEV